MQVYGTMPRWELNNDEQKKASTLFGLTWPMAVKVRAMRVNTLSDKSDKQSERVGFTDIFAVAVPP